MMENGRTFPDSLPRFACLCVPPFLAAAGTRITIGNPKHLSFSSLEKGLSQVDSHQPRMGRAKSEAQRVISPWN